MNSNSKIKTWRERIGAGPDFPLHAPTDVERAMEAEIAELRTRFAAPADTATALEAAAKLAIKFTAVPRDLLGPATSQMKAVAAKGEKLAFAIRALLPVAPAPSAAPAGDISQSAPVSAPTASAAQNEKAAAANAVVQALKGEIPLVEPVYIGKALRAGRKAKVCLSGGTGPLACVMLVNIQLSPWIYTEDTAKAFADGYNRAIGDLRHAVLEVAEQDRSAATSAGPANTISDLTTTACPACEGNAACDECDGQGHLIVSRADMAALASTEHDHSEGGHHD